MPSSADFSSEEILDEIISLTVQFEDQYKQAFYRSIEESIADPALLELLQDISDGTVIDMTPQVEDVLRNLNVPVDELIDVLRDAMMRVGQVTADTIGLEIAFDMTNPRAAQYAATLGARSINASEAVRQSIREIVKQVVEGEMSIQNAKRLIKERAGLLPQHSQAVARYYDNLVASGSTARRARELANQYANRLLNYRADMIARTEIGAAQSYGQWELWQQARDANLVPLDAMRIWMTAKDERVCDVCGPMNGQVASIDGVWFTPNGPVHYPTEIHPNCRCASGLIFSRGRAREFMNKSADLGYEYWLLEKHLAGTVQDHDQSAHGRRRRSIGSNVTFGEEYREWVKANGMANFTSYDFEDEEIFDKHFDRASPSISRGLKDDVARALGSYIADVMTTAEMVDAVVQLSGPRQRTGTISELLADRPFYVIDDISLIMLKQAAGVVSSGISGLPVGSADAVSAGITIGPEAMLDRGLVPSRWVLEQAKFVFGENSPEAVDLARQITIAEAIPKSLVVDRTDDSERLARSLVRQMAGDPRSIALASLTEQTVGKIVDKMMREGGEDARPAVADFLESAYDKASIAVPATRSVTGENIKVSAVGAISATSKFSKPDFDRSGRNGADELGYEIARTLVASWAQSSSSHESTLMMQAAVSELGASPGYRPDDYSLGRRDSYKLDQLKPEAQKLIKTATRAQYELTQRMFREIGIEEVTIARGMNFAGKEPYKPVNGQLIYEANAVLRPLSAWAVDVKDAKSFSQGAQILFQRVPVERIFSTPMTGMGCFDESECLFIFKDGDVFPIIDVMAMPPNFRPTESELVQIINEYDLPAIVKAELPTIYPDARIEDADWAKRTFNFPDVTTAKQYRERFGLQDDEALAEHIKEYRGTPYWEGVPSKIKTALLKSQLSKHLGTQHDQKTHGRRKTAQQVVLGKDTFDSAQTAHEELREYKDQSAGYQGGLKDNIAQTIGDALEEEFSEDDLRETARLISARIRRDWDTIDPALSTLGVDEESFDAVLKGLVVNRTVDRGGLPKLFGNQVIGAVMTREELGADPQLTDDTVAMSLGRLWVKRDPTTGAPKVMADLEFDFGASEAYGAGISDEFLTTTVEVKRPPSDKPVSELTAGEFLFGELKEGFETRARSDLQTMAREDKTTEVIRTASGISGISLGIRRTETGGLELAAVSSEADPSAVSGYKFDAIDNMRNLGLMEATTRNGYSVANTLVQGWATSSASNSSQLLHDQVSEMFGLADFTLQSSPSTERQRSIILDDSYYNSRTKPVIRRVAELMYENTQALLAETPGDSITLYRGLTSNELWARAFEAADSRLSTTLNVEQLPLSSWSGDVSTAKEFARRGADLGALVMGTTVPKSRIFSTPFTGLGCYDEKEFVVLGSESDPVVVFVDPQRLREAEALDIVVDSFVDSATALSEATIKKAAEGNINIDADIRNADWVKQTFDFPEVTTAKKYREEFGLEDDEALAEHIKEWKGTPYWEGIPSKIKTGLLKARLAKHLGSQHDQQTHGRRKTSAYSVGREAPAGYRDESKPRWAAAWDYLQKEKPPWWREPELGEDGLPLPHGQYGIDYDYPNISDALGEVPGGGIIQSIDREYRAQSKQMILRAISLGEITPAEATERYKYEAEPSGGGEEWETLPPELYHASPYVSAIKESGGLKTRDEVEGTGLGGGPSNTISLTTDRAVAESITRSLKEAQYAVNLSNSDALANTKRASGSYWPDVEKMAREVYGIDGEPKTAEERFDLYRSYASMREVNEGVLYPLFFGVEAETIASYDPSDIGYVVVRPSVEDAKGWQVSALGEWRVPTGDALELVDTVVSKHLGSQHDQKTHGRRKASKAYTVRDDTYIDITYGNYKGDVSPIGWMAGEDGYDITELDAYYDDMLDVRRGDIDGHLKFIAEDAMSRWFYYGKQSVMRTIASSMMGIGHYASQGDEPYKEKFGDNVMDRVYSGDGPIELIGEHMLHTVALLRSSALAEPSEREWFRGMVVDTKSPILRMTEGDRFVMPPSSFGGHRDIGLAFTRGGPQEPSAQMAEREEASVFNIEWRDVLFRLEPGAQGTLSPSTVSRTPGGEGFPFEIVANGEFEVVSVDRPFYDYEGAEDELVEITVRQVTTYDPKTGEYVEVG